MDEKIRKSQVEEVMMMLKREGFRELNDHEIEKEPYKTLIKVPECSMVNHDMKSFDEHLYRNQRQQYGRNNR